LEDCSGELTAWLRKAGMGQGAVAILRPDKFVYALVPAAELPAAVRRLAADLGVPGPRESLNPAPARIEAAA